MQLELRKLGIIDERIYKALSVLSKNDFLPKKFIGFASEDVDIEIFDGVFISKTSDIVKMINIALSNNINTRNVLEIGTGSGWQTALLSQIYDRVYTIENDKNSFIFASNKLKKLNKKIFLKLSDGKRGWIESSPFDAIFIDACCNKIPKSLIEQLCTENGVIVFVKEADQKQFFHSLCSNDNLNIIKSQFEVQRNILQ